MLREVRNPVIAGLLLAFGKSTVPRPRCRPASNVCGMKRSKFGWTRKLGRERGDVFGSCTVHACASHRLKFCEIAVNSAAYGVGRGWGTCSIDGQRGVSA